MGNPSTSCTVQVSMSLSKRRHRQSLSLQLEQLGQLGSGIDSCEKKKSASALSSPKVTEEKSIASFLGSKQVTRRKPSSLCGTEEFLKGIELHGGASSDRKPTSFNPFRGHRRVGSGSTVTPCKSLESPREKGGSLSFRKDKSLETPREKGGSLSFRKDRSTESPREKGGSLSFRKDKFAKIAASLFHSPTKIERSMSMSRLAYKATPEEVVSLRQKFQMASDAGSQTPAVAGGKGNVVLQPVAQDIEESARPLISNASSLQHECVIGITNLKDEGEEEFYSTTASDDPLSFTGDASGMLSDHDSQVFVDALDTVQLSNVNSEASPTGASSNELLYTELQSSSCISELDPYGWKITSSLSDMTPNSALPCSSEKSCCSSLEHPESNPKSCPDDIVVSPATEPPSVGSRSSRMETDSSEENVGESRIYAAVEDIQSLLFTTEKVTEEELTEAAVLSSLTSEEYLAGPLFFSSEDSQKTLLTSKAGRYTTYVASPDVTGVKTTCKSEACLTKCMSFEPVARDKSKAEADRKSKVRKRRRSVSASGIGAMLLKVVRVSDSGPMLTRRLPKVGPEVISGADALRAREYVLQKTAQISMGRAYESSSPVSTPAVCRCQSKDAVKPTDSKFFDLELHSEGDHGVELEQHSKDDPEGVDDTGCRGLDCTCEARQRNQQTTSEMVPRHLLPDPANTNAESACTQEGTTPTLVEVESCFHERIERVNSNLQPSTPDGQFESQTKSAALVNNASANTSAAAAGSAANADDRRGGKSRKKSSSRGRNSYDSDSLTDCPKPTRSNSGLGRAHTTTNSKQASSQSTTDANVAISRERSRSFISRLQAPSGISSVDVFHLAPSSISILANPSFSSSHQDRLWEEQAEAYSSGGRGTPGREEEATGATGATGATAAAATNVFLHSPSPGIVTSSDDHQVPSASASLRRGLVDSSAGTALSGEKGRHKRRGQGKKRGRPHTPLRSLLANDVHSKCTTRPSPEGGHFIQQIMSRIRGTSGSKCLSSPKSPDAMSKRRNIWSSCICFSIK